MKLHEQLHNVMILSLGAFASMMYILIVQGEDPSLWSASLDGRLEVVEALIDRGADINQTTDVRAYLVTVE